MIYKDYYKELGVGKTATSAEIKKAYRTLANKYHPDKTKGDKAAEEKFKDINEANEVLSDPVKRKKYDQFGADWKHYEEAGAQPGGFDWSKYAAGGGGQTYRTTMNESDGMFADEGVNDLFEMLFGQRSGQHRGRRGVAIKGEDLETETTLSLEEAYHGTTRLIHLNGQTIKVTIKPGVADQQTLRIPGKGRRGLGGGPNGDLYLNVRIAPNPEFQRKGNDLHRDLPVDLYTALLGGKTQITTLKGRATVTIPKGTPNGKELRLQGLGMPVYGKKNEFGNLLVKVDILLPEQLGEEEIDLFRKLASLRK
ncbi:MAG TPA: DnaJ C-terminal domain-containing protein [Candidatus Kryptobacter bacterium]|nr:MAG: molecular chaperone DnaJ [Ignavibacteriae bacterium 37-53-5]HQT91037.1 DnaJ C-terminal domain-containing protein [Candidatus Kryptobacter bacterium]